MAGQIPTKGAKPKSTPAKRTPAKAAATKATPSKAVAKVSDKQPGDLTPAKAASLTKRIQGSVENVIDLLHEAFQGRAWKALGHKNWDEYIEKEFGSAPLALPRTKRKPTVDNLTERGWSTRAISAATGVDQKTVVRDQHESAAKKKAAEANASPDEPPILDIPESDITEVPEGEEEKRTGLDGKSYPASKPEREPVVVNIVSAAKSIAKDVDAVRIRLDSLFSREDYEDNQVSVQGVLETAVSDILDTLVEEFADLFTERAPEPEPAV